MELAPLPTLRNHLHPAFQNSQADTEEFVHSPYLNLSLTMLTGH
jgi:CBS domain-containing protein